MLSLVRTIAIGRSSQRWPTVVGRVVALEVITIQRGGQGSTTYRPTITYRYTVNGRDYEGNRIRAGNFLMGIESWNQEEARAELDGYYPGSAAVVHFNPERPGYSLLQPGAARVQYLVAGSLAAGGAILAGVFWLAFFGV